MSNNITYRGITWEYCEGEYEEYYHGHTHGYDIFIEVVDFWTARIEWGWDGSCGATIYEEEAGLYETFRQAVDGALNRIAQIDKEIMLSEKENGVWMEEEGK